MSTVTVGVLALQGGFSEHLALLRRAATQLQQDQPAELKFQEVRNAQDLAQCDALIIPGGESTTMALIASRSGLLEPLRDFVKVARKPTWGTCAGLIMLSEKANATKKGGQDLIGGLDVQVHRNHFGRQIESFEANVDLPFLVKSSSLLATDSNAASTLYPGVFIRAPVVERLLNDNTTAVAQGGAVEVLAVLPCRTQRVKGSATAETDEIAGGEANDIVAVRQGNVVGTSFHPELTDDARMHVWWLEQVLQATRELSIRSNPSV